MEITEAIQSNQMLQNKLRSKKDLYEYMSVHLNMWLPQQEQCRLSFLQAILQDKKKCLKASNVKMQNINDGWHEFAIKNIWQFIENDLVLQEYLPWEEMKEGRFPDKRFFWGVAFTVKPQWANQFYELCIKERNKVKVNPFQKKTIIVSEFWQQKLAEHEFVSKCKSSKKQSIVIEQEVRPYKKRDARNKVVVELYSDQVDNIPNTSDINKSKLMKPFKFDFSSSRNTTSFKQQSNDVEEENQEQVNLISNFKPFQTLDSKKQIDQQSSLINDFELQKIDKLQIGSDQKEFVPNSQLKTGPSKKRRLEDFREYLGEEDELMTLQNFDFNGEQQETIIKNKSPHKSGKKHKVKEEKKE